MKIAAFINSHFGGARKAFVQQIKRLSTFYKIDIYVIKYDNSKIINNYERWPDDFSDMECSGQIIELEDFRKKNLQLPVRRIQSSQPYIDKQKIQLTKNYIKYSKKIANMIDAQNYDLAFIHRCFLTNAPPILQYLRTPKVLYLAEPFRILYEKKNEYNGVKFYFRRRLLKMLKIIDYTSVQSADIVLANSHYTKEYMRHIYHINAKVNYLGPGIDENLIRSIPDQDIKNQIITVGALWPIKGNLEVVKAVSRIAENIRPKVIFCYSRGSEQYMDSIKEIANKDKVFVEFKKNLSDEEIIREYKSSICSVYLPYYEPFGLGLIESQACGTPVIAINEAGPRESLIDGIGGLYVTNRDADVIADKILKISQDINLRNRLIKNTKEHFNNYWTWNKSIDHLKTIIESFN